MTEGMLSAADVAAVTRNNDCYDGFGNGGWIWIILLAFLFRGNWGGYGGYGGGGFNSPAGQGFATRTDIDAALATQGIETESRISALSCVTDSILLALRWRTAAVI